MSVQNDTIAERVARGAAFLDANTPWWVQAVDLDSLDMSEGCNCIGGQLNTSFHTFSAKYGLTLTIAEHLGFDANANSEKIEAALEYAALTSEWRRVIRARRENIA